MWTLLENPPFELLYRQLSETFPKIFKIFYGGWHAQQPSDICKVRTLLLSFDVIKPLYQNPHNYCLEVITFWLLKYPQVIPRRINHKFIIEALKWILRKNYFLFHRSCFDKNVGYQNERELFQKWGTETKTIHYDLIC